MVDFLYINNINTEFFIDNKVITRLITYFEPKVSPDNVAKLLDILHKIPHVTVEEYSFLAATNIGNLFKLSPFSEDDKEEEEDKDTKEEDSEEDSTEEAPTEEEPKEDNTEEILMKVQMILKQLSQVILKVNHLMKELMILQKNQKWILLMNHSRRN